MVFFQCDGCGEALKKAKVESHRFQCRNSAVSCIDCNVVFSGNSYAQHTTCVSEAERYQGQLYKGVSNKQARKQEQQQGWLDNVRAALQDASGVDARMRSVLERLVAYDNIPRKKAKFENFCRNSLGVRDEPIIARIWEDYVNKAAAASATEQAEESVEVAAVPEEKGTKRPADEVSEVSKVKKSKTEEKEGKADNGAKQSKKAKKEKVASEDVDKKSSKKEKATDSETCAKVKKSKKEKKEKVTKVSEDVTEPNAKADKKVKKSKKGAQNTETLFQWDSAILKAVEEAKGESLDVGKLRKKITKEFLLSVEKGSKDEAKQLFSKALKRTCTVQDDKVVTAIGA